MTRWPLVALGQVLLHRKEFITINDLQTYKRCRAQLHAQGIVLRDVVTGAEIKTKEQQVCRAGEFLVAEIDAKVGGYGIIPKDLDGAIVSSHYFLFEVNDQMLDRRFLHYFCRTPGFQEQVTAKGTTNYAAIRPSDVLRYLMPLPPLDEQRRIVARIEELAAKIEEARRLRREASEDAEILAVRARLEVFAAAARNGTVPLESVAVLERGRFSYRPRNEPRFFGGKHPWIQIGEIEAADKYITRWTQTLNDEGLSISRKFPKGTVLVSIAATIGATAILDFDCCVPDSIVGVTPRPGYESEYLYHYLGYVRGRLEDLAPQSAQKNVNLRILAPLPVPCASLSQQRAVVKYLDDIQAKMRRLRDLHSETAAELDALLPSILDRAFKGEL